MYCNVRGASAAASDQFTAKRWRRAPSAQPDLVLHMLNTTNTHTNTNTNTNTNKNQANAKGATEHQSVQPSSWSGLILHYNITVQKIEIHYKIQISLKIQKISTNTKYEQLYKVAKGISECDTQHGRCLDRSCVTYSYVTHTCSCVTHTHDFVT